ncbi:MAG: peptidase S10 [Candidatus Kapabacteria bacterium]|nr:peptidase S10 [Candidatus Kapabacteria bacterium]
MAGDTTKAVTPIFQKPLTSKRAVTIGGKRIDYEVTTGHLTLVKEDGTERAKIFFVAYTKTGVSDPATRPLTFSFNGGPGSSSVWLHLGVLGPRRVAMNDDGTTLPPPYALVDNEHSWLDLTDMVFIDPVSTGFSRAADEKDARNFHGYNQDIESVGEFVRRYVSDYKRWASPKYLIGESYGTTRASALGDHLQQRYGMYLNGIILVSAVLNFQTIDVAEGNDLPFTSFLPTFAVTAWYHKRLPADMQAKTVEQIAAEARAYAMGDYALTLMKGDALTPSERNAAIETLRRYTGLSADYLDKANLRPVIFRVCQELLRDKGLIIGRFDSRYTGLQSDRLAESMERDPSHHPTIAGCFSTCINDYLTRELGVTTTLPYEVLTGRVHPWDYSNVQNEYLNVAPRLRNAMLSNPNLRVWVLNGYYDLATPFYGTEYTFDHMFLPQPAKPNLQMTYYGAGHMMYLLKTELAKMKQDATTWFKP